MKGVLLGEEHHLGAADLPNHRNLRKEDPAQNINN